MAISALSGMVHESLDVRETCELGWEINEFAYQNKPKEKIERRARVALEKANGSV